MQKPRKALVGEIFIRCLEFDALYEKHGFVAERHEEISQPPSGWKSGYDGRRNHRFLRCPFRTRLHIIPYQPRCGWLISSCRSATSERFYEVRSMFPGLRRRLRINHPLDPKLVGNHSKPRREKRFAKGHLYFSVLRQLVKMLLCLCFCLDRQAQ